MHEAGLRLIINSIASTAAKYGIAIEPLLSLKIDFYARVFIRVRHSPAEVKFLAGKVMLVYSCDTGCGAWTTNMLGRNTKQIGKNDTVWFKHSIAQAPTADRLCEQCGSKTHLAGPMWGGPLHNAAFIEKILDDLEDADSNVYETKNRVEGMLTTALEELIVNEEVTKYTKDRKEGEEVIPKIPVETTDKHPFFFNISALAKVIHCVAPPDAAIKGALRHAGYVATRTHCEGGNIKTNAPWSVIWEIMREWVRQRHPIKEGALKETTAGWRIMQAARAVENEAEKEGQLSEDGAKNTREDETAAPKPADGKIKVKFDEVLGRDKLTKKLVRYQQNPRENWGPMTKAKGGA
jgi:tRNA (guanine26-N2/guanine27-N2)-dimethyltransferase